MSNPTEHHLNVRYLKRERVYNYLLAYAKRNKIPTAIKEHPTIREDYVFLTFRSHWQLQCFANRGREHYPFFEFI